MDSTEVRDLQPLLHRLSVMVRAPVVVLSSADGQIREQGVQGVLRHDRRILSRLVVTVDGHEPESVEMPPTSSGTQSWWGVCRTIGDPIPDPTIYLERIRSLTADGMVERLRLISKAQHPVTTSLHLQVGSDLADMSDIKMGRISPAALSTTTRRGLRFGAASTVGVTFDPAPDATHAASTSALSWTVGLDAGASWELDVVVTDRETNPGPFTAPTTTVPWATPQVSSADPTIPAVVDRGLADLEAMLLADGDDVFVAAGAPWFLTLFGRDSLWTARMLLPLGTDLALGTLRTLARRQGTRHDPTTEEQPGKILHEVRNDTLALGDGQVLPKQYYGTIDATPLWVILLVDAWRWGAAPHDIAALLPPLHAALDWMQAAVAAGHGLLRYVDEAGTGLTNQGWKDSGDSIQFADGRLATPPIALIEGQAYAYEAAIGAADLLDAFDEPGGDKLRAWADDIAHRVRDHYWQTDHQPPYLAIALDGDNHPVDALTSNGGHALGTGILTPDEAAHVAATMTSPQLNSGLGLRTLTTASPRFALLSYHGGTVWPHDTAIVAAGLAREGFLTEATDLTLGLVEAARSFNHRLPELFGVTTDNPRTLAYPAACSPQAWAAAAPLAALIATLGLRPDLPNATITIPHHVDPRLAGLRIGGLTLGSTVLTLEVRHGGRLDVSRTGDSINVIRQQPMQQANPQDP